MDVNCDKCDTIFKIQVKREDLENDIELSYFECPNCSTKYPIAKSNTITRELSTKLTQAKYKGNKAIEEQLKEELAILNK